MTSPIGSAAFPFFIFASTLSRDLLVGCGIVPEPLLDSKRRLGIPLGMQLVGHCSDNTDLLFGPEHILGLLGDVD